MPGSTRREFIQSTSFLISAALLGFSFKEEGHKPLLSFSTLGCPDWSFEQIVTFAKQHGYDGIEIRGLQRELDLVKCKQFETPIAIKQTLQLVKDAGLKILDLGSSCTLHFAEGAERTKNIDEGKRFIDLANDIECPYVRVFPNLLPKEQAKEKTIQFISDGLLELADHAKGSKVKVLLESHGDLVYTDDLEKLMQAATHEQTGLIWDVCNMWVITKEQPEQVYKRLKKYIHHTHIKDATLVDGKPQYTLLGKGEVPIIAAIDILAKDEYKGYYSFEWEKLWHPEIAEPEIAEPEIALANYAKLMKEHFKK